MSLIRAEWMLRCRGVGGFRSGVGRFFFWFKGKRDGSPGRSAVEDGSHERGLAAAREMAVGYRGAAPGGMTETEIEDGPRRTGCWRCFGRAGMVRGSTESPGRNNEADGWPPAIRVGWLALGACRGPVPARSRMEGPPRGFHTKWACGGFCACKEDGCIPQQRSVAQVCARLDEPKIFVQCWYFVHNLGGLTVLIYSQ